MRRALLLCVALAAVVAAVLFATCSDRHDAAEGPVRTVAAAVDPTKPRPRVRQDATDVPAGVVAESGAAGSSVPARAEAVLVVTPPAVKVAQPRHELRGRIVDARGEPVAGRPVQLVSLWLPLGIAGRGDGYAYADAISGADGRFALPYYEGGPRGLLVKRSAPSSLAQWVGHGLSDDHEIEIVLPDKLPSVTVHVTDAADAKPVGEAEVWLVQVAVPGMGWRDCPAQTTWGDSHPAPGTFQFDDVAPGPMTLYVVAPGRAPADRTIVVPAEGASTFDFALKAGITVRGVVVDDATGLPVREAEIRWSESGTFSEPETSTDEEGCFSLGHLPFEPRNFHRLHARALGYADTEFFAGTGQDSDTECAVSVRLRRAARVAAHCVDAGGSPVPLVLVGVLSDYDVTAPNGMASTATSTAVAVAEADGRASLENIHPGTDGLELRTRFYVDGVPVLERTFPPLRPGETRDLGDVVLAPGLTLRGVVLDADGKPVAGATVVAAAHDADDADHAAIGDAVISHSGRRAETQPDGTFALMGLTSGLWDLYASADIASPGRLSIGLDPAAGYVSLRLPRVVALEGRVVDAKGSPVAKADVRSAREEFGLRTIVSCGTGDDGRFSVPGFDADSPEVDVSVKPPGGAAQKFTARPGVPSTELRLRP